MGQDGWKNNSSDGKTAQELKKIYTFTNYLLFRFFSRICLLLSHSCSKVLYVQEISIQFNLVTYFIKMDQNFLDIHIKA